MESAHVFAERVAAVVNSKAPDNILALSKEQVLNKMNSLRGQFYQAIGRSVAGRIAPGRENLEFGYFEEMEDIYVAVWRARQSRRQVVGDMRRKEAEENARREWNRSRVTVLTLAGICPLRAQPPPRERPVIASVAADNARMEDVAQAPSRMDVASGVRETRDNPAPLRYLSPPSALDLTMGLMEIAGTAGPTPKRMTHSRSRKRTTPSPIAVNACQRLAPRPEPIAPPQAQLPPSVRPPPPRVWPPRKRIAHSFAMDAAPSALAVGNGGSRLRKLAPRPTGSDDANRILTSLPPAVAKVEPHAELHVHAIRLQQSTRRVPAVSSGAARASCAAQTREEIEAMDEDWMPRPSDSEGDVEGEDLLVGRAKRSQEDAAKASRILTRQRARAIAVQGGQVRRPRRLRQSKVARSSASTASFLTGNEG